MNRLNHQEGFESPGGMNPMTGNPVPGGKKSLAYRVTFTAPDRPLTDADLGRWNVTKREEDRHVFRVPSLRNVAVTAPYFHDGSAETLEEAVQIMSEYQLGRPLAREQLDAIVAFLQTLTGEYRGVLLR